MRSEKSLYNILAASVLRIINLVVGMILPKIMLNMYGSSINGVVFSTIQIY